MMLVGEGEVAHVPLVVVGLPEVAVEHAGMVPQGVVIQVLLLYNKP